MQSQSKENMTTNKKQIKQINGIKINNRIKAYDRTYKRVELSDDMLRTLQLNLLEMLIEIDRICKKYDIKYSIDGGTLLGAVRHSGFIPWDDDIDVIMRREEYEKFYKACRKNLDKTRFFLQEYRTDRHYRWGYEKLRRKNTEFVRLGQEHLKSRGGIFVDIFVVDNVPDQLLWRKIHLFTCFLIRKLLYSELGMRNENSIILRAWYRFLYCLVPRNVIFDWRNRIAEKCNKKRTELVRHMTYPYVLSRYGMPGDCFDEMIDMQFEGYTFRAFRKYDKYLTALYGDYMKLPPKEKQKSHLEVSKIRLLDPVQLYSEEELGRLL